MRGGGKRECGAGRDSLQGLVKLGRQRAHAEEAAAARAWLMAARRKRMVAMMGMARGLAHAMVDHVGMGEALDRMLPMAKGEHARRHDEAKRCERRKRDRQLESESARQCRQHPFWLLLSLQTGA